MCLLVRLNKEFDQVCEALAQARGARDDDEGQRYFWTEAGLSLL